ncbi:hypothetical protein Nepgr_016409 [Nepenthes gracilis]|uniref:Uncharacterized protein n=1 Tax=Nepenthes gracilis TaxID=150966 RepID=A0AAD3SMM5_NEPGR|nr:hypothetical protein Nepgr_016409 [Nepenthes gracilis]
MEVGADANLSSKVCIKTGNSSLLPDLPYFEAKIDYQWKPVKCGMCKGIGHSAPHCRSVNISRPSERILAKALPSSLLGRDKFKGPSPVSPVKNVSRPRNLPSSVDIDIEQQLAPPGENSACFFQPNPGAIPSESSIGTVAPVCLDVLAAVDIAQNEVLGLPDEH